MSRCRPEGGLAACGACSVLRRRAVDGRVPRRLRAPLVTDGPVDNPGAPRRPGARLARRPAFHIEHAAATPSWPPNLRLRRRLRPRTGALHRRRPRRRDADAAYRRAGRPGSDGTVIGGCRWFRSTTAGVPRRCRAAGCPPPQARGPHGSAGRLSGRPAHARRGGGRAAVRRDVQARNDVLFRRRPGSRCGPAEVAGTPHVLMRLPIARSRPKPRPESRVWDHCAELPAPRPATSVPTARPSPATDVTPRAYAIVPSMVEREPRSVAGCAPVLVTSTTCARWVLPVVFWTRLGAARCGSRRADPRRTDRGGSGLRRPVLGGHPQLGRPRRLSVTALGQPTARCPAAEVEPGMRRLTADLAAAGARASGPPVGLDHPASSGRTAHDDKGVAAARPRRR